MTVPPVTMTEPALAPGNELTANERLIVALDMQDKSQVMETVLEIGDAVSFYKVGVVRLLDIGFGLVEALRSEGKKVFLDLKSFDIEQTVASTVDRARELGATFVTVHANSRAIRAAKAVAGDDMKILAVTYLTSLSQEDVRTLYGITDPLEEAALKMARFLVENGCDGVIASAEEAGRLRQELGQTVLIVTPGIRLDGTSVDDHKRPGTPRKAIADGADYLVVGRPIYESADPLATALQMIAEIQKGMDDRA